MKYYLILLITLVLNCVRADSPVSYLFKTDGAIQDVYFCGNDTTTNAYLDNISYIDQNKTVLIKTYDGMLYQSTNEGVTFTKLQEKLIEAYKKLNLPQVYTGKVIDVYQSKVDQSMLILRSSQGIAFRSNNCGTTLEAFKYPEEIIRFMPSLIDGLKIIGIASQECVGALQCNLGIKRVWISQNKGNTWSQLITWVQDIQWGHLDSQNSLYFVPPNRILIQHYPCDGACSYDKILLKTQKSVIIYTDDFLKTKNVISETGIKFHLTQPFLFVIEEHQNKELQLLVSQNLARNYQLKPIKIPIDRFSDTSFTILESRHGVIFLNINHEGEYAKFGNIYVSNFYGVDYSLSLLHNVRDDEGYSDFTVIESLEGVYIANHYEHNEAETYKQQVESLKKTGAKSIDSKVESFRKSVISFDQGAEWVPLKAPEYDSDLNKIECTGDCSLHLKGFTDRIFSPVYSHKSSTGIIIGIGNTGHYLNTNKEEARTYLSRDGGHTWLEIRKGSYIYEVGDHGGLIVMVEDQKLTNEVIYSWDEGLSWETFKVFFEEKIFVVNLVIEPEQMAQGFILHGRNDNQGVVIAIDFNPVNQRVCKGIYKPGTQRSDYEVWSPAWTQNKCLLGKRLQYVRRKRESQCWNDEDYERKEIAEYCDCTEDDYECDVLFYRDHKSLPCVPITDKFKDDITFLHQRLEMIKPPDDCVGTYEVPSGYRRIAGDFCSGGIEKGPIVVKCPEKKKDSTDQIKVDSINQIKIDRDQALRQKMGYSQDDEQKVQDEVTDDSNWFFIKLIFIIALLYGVYTKFQDEIQEFVSKTFNNQPKHHKYQNSEYERVMRNVEDF